MNNSFDKQQSQSPNIAESPEKQQSKDIENYVIELIDEEKYVEAARIMGIFLSSIVFDTKEKEGKKWIDVFCNQFGRISMSIGMAMASNPELAVSCKGIFENIEKLIKNIIEKIDNGITEDANAEDQKEIMDLVKELMRILHSNTHK